MPGIWLLVRKSLSQHALSTGITVGATALACGLVMAVFAINTQTRRAFVGGETGFDAVVGARGSPLQLVLNTVFHLETSPGNIPWASYLALRKDPLVELAIPYAVGDTFRGFRIVGTSEEIFSRFEYRKGRKFRCRAGGFFDARRAEAVIGDFVARQTGLDVGDTFHPSHALSTDDRARHETVYVVKGILAPTNSPSDRVLWIPIEGMFRMDGHVLRGSGEAYEARGNEEIPDEHKEVSAVMLKLKGGAGAGFQLDTRINKGGQEMTIAWPISRSLAELFDKLGWVTRVLELVAYLVVVVAVGSIAASIYNTMNERRREFAILRALGAQRRTVFGAIVTESATIAALGAVVGFLVYGLVLAAAAYIVRARTGVVLEILALHPVLLAAPAGIVVLGAVAGVLPACKAYATDVASNLVPAS